MNNVWTTWGEAFNVSLQSVWLGFAQFTPKLVLAIVLFIIGWVLGSVVSKAFEQVCGALKIDKLFQSIGADNFFRKAGMNLNTGYFVGQVVKWFVIIVFLLPSLSLVGLESIGDFLRDGVLGYLPRVIVAVFVLIIAAVVSEGISKTIKAGARSMDLSSANLLATISKYAVWIFALVIALGQLGIAEYYMGVLFTGIVVMLSLGGALAFGLGGKDAAARLLEKLGNEMSHRD